MIAGFTRIPNVSTVSRSNLDPNTGAITLAVRGKHVCAYLSATIRKRFSSGRVNVYLNADYTKIALEEADANDPTAYRFSPKSGSLYGSAFIRLLMEKGHELPARFIAEWYDDGFFLCVRQNDVPAMKPKAARKPRTKGLESLLPKG